MHIAIGAGGIELLYVLVYAVIRTTKGALVSSWTKGSSVSFGTLRSAAVVGIPDYWSSF